MDINKKLKLKTIWKLQLYKKQYTKQTKILLVSLKTHSQHLIFIKFLFFFYLEIEM